jgi:hypothetical protein
MSSALTPQFDFLKNGIPPEAIINEQIPPAVEVTAAPEKITAENALQVLQTVKIDLSKDVPPPPVCLEIVNGYNTATWGTLGNFSMITGKAKSKKTFLIGIAVAAAVSRDVLNVRGLLPTNKRNALYFDTEQGEYHVYKAAKRICRMAGIELPENLIIYHLRKYAPSERFTLIREAVYNTPGLGLVVIDGIRDLLTSINDEDQATFLTSQLMKWSEELHIHIICVLHQNKGDSNARGHLGTELVNKAETVLSVAVDGDNKDVSIVEATQTRDKQPDPFAFEIDETGLPRIVEDWEVKSEKYNTQKGIVPQEIPEATHLKLLREIFSHTPQPKRSGLISELKNKFADYGKKIGDTKARDFITHYVQRGYIQKHGKDHSPKSYYTMETEPPKAAPETSTDDLF